MNCFNVSALHCCVLFFLGLFMELDLSLDLSSPSPLCSRIYHKPFPLSFLIGMSCYNTIPCVKTDSLPKSQASISQLVMTGHMVKWNSFPLLQKWIKRFNQQMVNQWQVNNKVRDYVTKGWPQDYHYTMN